MNLKSKCFAWIAILGVLFCADDLLAAQKTNVAPKILPPLEKADWIWQASDASECQLRKTFNLDEGVRSATILITADNGFELYVNGSLVGGESGAASEIWQTVKRYDLTRRLTKGKNIIGIRGLDLGGPRGVVAALRVDVKKGTPLELVTDGTWRAALKGAPADYSHPEFVEGQDWSEAQIIGRMGIAPWGKLEWADHPALARAQLQLSSPNKDFNWPEEVAFVGDDCSVYVPLRGDAWGVCFRVEDWSRAYTEFDLPCPSKIGRKLYALRPGPDAKPRVIIDAGKGVLGSPSVSFDGSSLLIAMAPEGEKFFHIYRVPATGGKPQRLTDGPFHDIDPVELPDGRIVFTSTRVGTFEEYHEPPSRALFRMNADGTDIHPITSTLIFDNEPKVMADGRIIFIRTDNFFDRGKVETQLHAIRPDGTDGLAEMRGPVSADYSVRLRQFGFGSPAPLPDGRLAFIAKTGNAIARPGAAERDLHKLPSQLGDIAPLPDGRLLGTVLRWNGARASSDVLAVIDPSDDGVVSIFQSDKGAIHSPVFLGSRKRPPVIPDYVERKRADQIGATGFLFCQNARFTTKTKADWKQIRAIRVLGAIPLTIRSSHSHIVHAGNETIELGTVPLAPDGSFFVEVPADTPIALQAVDGEGRSELNEMSWIYVRPGEHRSCIGCHSPRQSPPLLSNGNAQALRGPPLRLLGQGDAHRFRGNNAGVTGMMDLQFERFRECASLNLHKAHPDSTASGRDDIAALLRQLTGKDDALKISAAQRLGIFRVQEAATLLAQRLQETNREVRVSAALALATCATRESASSLMTLAEEEDPVLSQAAIVGLENLTGHIETRAINWKKWFAENSWESIEKHLIENLRTHTDERQSVVALGHIGGAAARAALRESAAAQALHNPYPIFENGNRTDIFTFSAESPFNPRTLQETIRALGQLRDTNAIPMLRDLLSRNLDPRADNMFLAEAAIEALGRIGTRECETALIRTFAELKEYWQYVGWYSDHPALYACHESPLHARIIEALDQGPCASARSIVPQLIRSVPTDPDRALFADNDDYETLVGRLIRRSGEGDKVVETCLALLGDSQAVATPENKTAISTTDPAWAGHPGPENRAAQILSLVCRN
ncbi:MAG: HzsA-related protein, partial [Limisphaerales bacterium]